MPTPSTSTSGRKSRPLKERQSSRKMTMMKRTRMCKLSNRLRKSRKTNLQLKNLNVRISDYEYHSCFCIFNYNHDIQNYLGTLGGLCSHEGIIIYEASGVRSGIGYMSGWSTCIRIFFIITAIGQKEGFHIFHANSFNFVLWKSNSPSNFIKLHCFAIGNSILLVILIGNK